MLHTLKDFCIDEAADPRFGEPSTKRGHQDGFPCCIGGDAGDLLFRGFDVVDGKTWLRDPTVATNLEVANDFSEEEWLDMAREIFKQAYQAIGLTAIY
jgi:hypothetical protein